MNLHIYLKGCYTLLGEIEAEPKAKLSFTAPLKNKPDVVVEIRPDEKRVESFHEGTISKIVWDDLQESEMTDLNTLTARAREELGKMNSDMSTATRKVLHFIKYWLRCDKLEERLFSVKGTYWSEDKSEWKRLSLPISVTLDFDYVLAFDKYHVDIVQQYIEKAIEPLAAFRHLHRAKNELIPRYKWIDATIAAELAIKEFFVKLRPELEPILLEVPSPPLRKLYGAILESYTNVRSPKLTAIAKGAERRNRLLHKPQDEQISDKEASEYVHDVETALYHLLTLLYPKDPFIKKCFRYCCHRS